jgi:thymidylate kinase
VTDRPFYVLLGPDYAGKSSVMAEFSAALPGWQTLSTDDDLMAGEHRLIVQDVLPGLGPTYSADFLASLLGTAVVHLRDQLERQEPDVPVLMDSYYYKILAKCRLAGLERHPLYTWWRSFPQPRGVIYLDVSPETAWRRSGRGARLNALEHFGDRPEWFGFESYQKNLGKLLLEETGRLPVTVVEERSGTAATTAAVREVLAA